MDQESRRVSLKWKIGGTFAGVMLVLGLFVTVAVYQLTKMPCAINSDQRVLLLANALSDAAAGHIVGGKSFGASCSRKKIYACRWRGIRFYRKQQRRGHCPYLGDLSSGTPARTSDHVSNGRAYRRELSLSGRAVYATGVPILEGQLGTVHVGFWVDAVEKRSNAPCCRLWE